MRKRERAKKSRYYIRVIFAWVAKYKEQSAIGSEWMRAIHTHTLREHTCLDPWLSENKKHFLCGNIKLYTNRSHILIAFHYQQQNIHTLLSFHIESILWKSGSATKATTTKYCNTRLLSEMFTESKTAKKDKIRGKTIKYKMNIFISTYTHPHLFERRNKMETFEIKWFFFLFSVKWTSLLNILTFDFNKYRPKYCFETFEVLEILIKPYSSLEISLYKNYQPSQAPVTPSRVVDQR